MRLSKYPNQYGGNLPYFQGAAFQRGHGIGGIFKSLARTFAPVIKKGLIRVGKKALETGGKVIGDVASGKNFKEAVKHRSKESGKQLIGEFVGSSSTINKVKKSQPLSRKRTVRKKGSKSVKRRKVDIFDH